MQSVTGIKFSHGNTHRTSVSEDGVSIFNENNIIARYVSLGDKFSSERRRWLKSALENFHESNYREDDTYSFSLSWANYNLLIIGGVDVVRIKKIFRNNEMIIMGKAKICLLSNSTPHDRAELLELGFDDVIDIARSESEEGVARISGIFRRYNLAYEHNRIERIRSELISKITCESNLNRRYKLAIITLIEARKFPVPYSRLCNLLSLDHDPMSVGALKVLICSIRKKLSPGVEINSISGFGYYLSIK